MVGLETAAGDGQHPVLWCPLLSALLHCTAPSSPFSSTHQSFHSLILTCFPVLEPQHWVSLLLSLCHSLCLSVAVSSSRAAVPLNLIFPRLRRWLLLCAITTWLFLCFILRKYCPSSFTVVLYCLEKPKNYSLHINSIKVTQKEVLKGYLLLTYF